MRIEILRTNKKTADGLEFIEKHKDLLDEVDLLMFYTTNGIYDKGFDLCEEVCQKFSIDEYIASAIIECCVKTGNFDVAEHYASVIQDYLLSTEKKNWTKNIFGDFSRARECRQKKISEYRMMPAFIPVCCYFGCDMHKTPW